MSENEFLWLTPKTESMDDSVEEIESSRATRAICRNPEVAIREFRIFQLLIDLLNEVAWIALTGAHLGTSALLVLCAFSAIQFFGLHHFQSIQTGIVYLIFPAGAVIFIIWVVLVQPQAAEMKVRSQVFATTWKNQLRGTGPWNHMSRFFESCRELEIYVGSFFTYKVSTMPKVLDMCIQYTITLLLAAAASLQNK